MCLALLQQWEGESRRHADGTGGMDTGESSTIDPPPPSLFFVFIEVYEGTRAGGRHRDGCCDPRRICMWYLFFLLIHLSLPLV